MVFSSFYLNIFFVFSIASGFLVVFLINFYFLRKKSFSLLATSHILIQLLIVSICFVIVATVRPTVISLTNWSSFILAGFLISIIFSEISYVLNYTNSQPIHLIPIEKLLSKKSKSASDLKPSFFREEGFLWSDFKDGIVTKRKETTEILERLKTENSLIIIGDQASGKSNILRNIGYELVNNGCIVFFINADSLDVNLALADIKNWDMSNVVVIIDDVHRNITMTSDFLNRVYSNNIRVILSSRPANFNILKEKSGQRLSGILYKRIEVKATEETIQDIVLKYVYTTTGNLEVSSEVIKEIIQKCGTDLWLLTYLLLAWNPKKISVEDIKKIDILREVYESRISHLKINDKNSLVAMETVCVLYQFEIPCSETYLIEMGLNKATLELVSEGFLIKKGTYYYLHHASVAKIYLDTLEHYHLVNDSTNLSIIILSSYLEKNKQDQSEVFYRLSIFPKSIEKKETILKEMFQQLRIEDIISQVKQEESLEKIGFFFQSLASIDKNYAKEILRSFSSEELLEKLLCHPFVRQQRNLIHDISKIDDATSRQLSQKRPKVALVIPVFNEEKLISSIQDAFDFVDEVVIIDDHSTDNTVKIASELGARVIQHKSNMGFYSSVRSGLEETLNSEIDIIILDPDFFGRPCWMKHIYIPNLIGGIMRHNSDLTVGYFGSQLGRYKFGWAYVQAMDRKGAEIFLKYYSSVFPDRRYLPYQAGKTGLLLSKVLHVEKIDLFNGEALGMSSKIESNLFWNIRREILNFIFKKIERVSRK
jgi:hypothetical protein